jgi:hypothetical protein
MPDIFHSSEHPQRSLTYKGLVLPLVLLSMLSGCASTAKLRDYIPLVESSDKRAYNTMYLRGIFNWWEAEAPYLLQKNEAGDYFAEVSLIADGQPYDFKFADSVYTPDLTCGAFNPAGQMAHPDKKIELLCAATAGNLKFTPAETGTYRFVVKPGNPAELSIQLK